MVEIRRLVEHGADALSENLSRLRQALEHMLSLGQVPVVFVDLDDTLNRAYGTNIEDAAAQALARLDSAAVLFGLNTGAPIEWAGLRVFSRLPASGRFPLALLASGQRAYAWSGPLRCYVQLPFSGTSKGHGVRMFANLMRTVVPGLVPRAIYIGDFPGPGDAVQPGIDDSIVRETGEALSLVIDVGTGRAARELQATGGAQVLCPPRSRGAREGVGVDATIRYLDVIAACLGEPQNRRIVWDTRCCLLKAISRVLILPRELSSDADAEPRYLVLDRASKAAFAPPPSRVSGKAASRHGPVVLRLPHPGLVHAGVRDGTDQWTRIYDVLLEPSASAVDQWEAALPPDVNVLTVARYDHTGNGAVWWDGVDYRMQ